MIRRLGLNSASPLTVGATITNTTNRGLPVSGNIRADAGRMIFTKDSTSDDDLDGITAVVYRREHGGASEDIELATFPLSGDSSSFLVRGLLGAAVVYVVLTRMTTGSGSTVFYPSLWCETE